MGGTSIAIDIAAAVIGYLLGTTPFGLVLTRLAGLGDIRAIGSGNIGATNVLRTGNRALAAGTFVGDGLKGTVAVLIGMVIGGAPGAMIAGLAAFLGHLFPVWLGFKGGKGVSTYIGIIAALWWPGAIFFCLVWLATAFTTRISSASALTASLLTPIVVLIFAGWPLALFFALLSLILWWRHSENIARLLAGTESRIGAKR
ncbi:MAG TPA: glycerol-3-phosphate 1-O-acyltransferase PlsY [Bauldia sp.]|nr:glycerol-3-phosphate 1-O-acyltransferase PlsY [Bauldia sp.]